MKDRLIYIQSEKNPNAKWWEFWKRYLRKRYLLVVKKGQVFRGEEL